MSLDKGVIMVRTIEELEGKVIVDIKGMYQYSEMVMFSLLNGEKVIMYNYEQRCGNDVEIQLEEVIGYSSDLLNSEIILAEEVQSTKEQVGDYGDTENWSFVKIGTINGQVTLRWKGRSNGHYSVGVDVDVMENMDVNDLSKINNVIKIG